MAPIGPSRRRSTTRRTTTGFDISVPAKLHLFVLMFLLVWLALWAVTEFFQARTLLTEPEASLVFFFIVWTLGGGLGLYICLWMIAGREIISLQSDILTIKHALFGYVRVREYDFRHVSNLRVDPEPYDSEGPRLAALYAFRTGPVAFEYGERTVRFGDGISEAEAYEIVAEFEQAIRKS
jgi:hypothetical protein